jgi:hypothetical protein
MQKKKMMIMMIMMMMMMMMIRMMMMMLHAQCAQQMKSIAQEEFWSGMPKSWTLGPAFMTGLLFTGPLTPKGPLAWSP